MALSTSNRGRMTLAGPGRLEQVSLAEFRGKMRLQELVFDLARELTVTLAEQGNASIPVQALFPQVAAIVDRYVREKVRVYQPADIKDLFLAPYYGWVLERLSQAIRPDAAAVEAPEVPRYESHRGPGSTGDVDFWTTREVREVRKSHVNFVVADTRKWEQSAAYALDQHPVVRAFVKNAGLGFAIPYLLNGRMHDYVPDFLIRLAGAGERYLILETKGFDPAGEIKAAAAERWVRAVNADGGYGTWAYHVAKNPNAIPEALAQLA